MVDSPRYIDEFKLSITRALADQLMDGLSGLTPVSLTRTNLDTLDPRPGIYELFMREGDAINRVYVGKASKNLPARLRKHHYKLSGREGISLQDVLFQCLYVDEDLEASAPEKMLINRYRAVGVLPWNTNGFGNNDPGRRRDTSLVKANHFDAYYPANLEYVLAPPTHAGEKTVREYLQAVKKALPFNLRFDTKAKVLGTTTIEVPAQPRSVEQILEATLRVLPAGWQATALPGYVILYPEINDAYSSARALWRTVDDRVVNIAGQNQLADAGEIAESDDADE